MHLCGAALGGSVVGAQCCSRCSSSLGRSVRAVIHIDWSLLVIGEVCDI